MDVKFVIVNFKAGDTINSVTKEFERIDQKIAQLPNLSFVGMREWT